MGLQDAAGSAGLMALSTANSIAGLGSTAEQIDALNNYDADFATWLQFGLGKVSQADAVLRSGQGIAAAYDAFKAGASATDTLSALTSGKGISALGSVGSAVGSILPWASMGLGAYQAATTGSPRAIIGTLGPAMAAAGSLAAAGTVTAGSLAAAGSAAGVAGLPLAALGAIQMIAQNQRKPSRNYFDPYMVEDLGDGKYLMMGESKDDFSDQTTDGFTPTSVGGNDWAIVYDKDTNKFSRIRIEDIVPQKSLGQLNPDMLEAEYQNALEGWRAAGSEGPPPVKGEVVDPTIDPVYYDYFDQSHPGDYSDISMAYDSQGYMPDSQKTASFKDLAATGDITKDSVIANAKKAIEDGKTLDFEYGLFKDSPVVVNSGSRKYPLTLTSLQSALQTAAETNGWDIGAQSQQDTTGDNMAIVVNRDDYKAQTGFDDNTIDTLIANGTIILDTDPAIDTTAPPADDTTTLTDTTVPVDDAAQYAAQVDYDQLQAQQDEYYNVASEMEQMLGLNPGDLRAISDQIKGSLENVETAYGSTIDRNGMKIIPKGQQEAALDELKTLLSAYNPYGLSGDLAGQATLKAQDFSTTSALANQQRDINMALANQQNALKKDYALWAKDQGITQSYEADSWDDATRYAAAIGGTVDAWGKIRNAAGQVVGLVKNFASLFTDPDDSAPPDIMPVTGPSLGDYDPSAGPINLPADDPMYNVGFFNDPSYVPVTSPDFGFELF